MKFRKSLLALVVLLCLAVGGALGADIEELKKAVVRIGHLEFKRDVPVRYLDRARLSEYIERLFESDYPDELARKEEELLFWMGFTPEMIDLKPLRRRIILENVGGLYNEKTEELLALEEFRNIDMINAPALAHELRHAIQDQHFNLEQLLGDLSDFDDRKLAALAAVEGDATLVMILQIGFDPELVGDALNADSILSFSALTGASTLASAPAILKYQLLMPYLEGMRFSQAIVAKRKWKGLNRVLGRKPLSSEQVLHPEKYLAGEKPLAVFTRFRPRRGELAHSGVIGEYYLNVLLMQGPEPADAASGWGGDLFSLYRDGDSRLLLWESHWDTIEDGSRFHDDFRRFLEREFRVDFRDGRHGDRPFLAGRSGAGYFFLLRDGARLFYARGNDRGQINELIRGGLYD
ncbi:MAG: hypothetical protein JXO51_07240 [Candidatus Aminicenantes bacterium]|nr:hypothetical protein [Candidatus Aminicenantes bacterium]